MNPTRSSLFAGLLALAACSAPAGGSGQANQCPSSGLDNDSCVTDDDCFSGFCFTTDGICTPPVSGSGGGYSCTSSADCDSVIGPDLVAQGVVGDCYGGNTQYSGCGFTCSSGNGSGSGS